MNATEYLEHLFAQGIREQDLPALQPIFQKRIWDRFKPGDGLETEVRVAFAHDPGASPSAMGHVDERTGTLTDEAEKPCRCWLWTAILVAGFLVMATGTWATIHWARSARTQAQRA